MSTKPGRTRAGRAASLKSVSVWDRVTAALQDRDVLIRLGIAFLGIVGFLFAVRGWKPLFPYREGDRIERGMVARVGFQRINQQETDRARREAVELVPFVFRSDASGLDPIPARLRTHLGSVAQAESPTELTPEVREAFGLVNKEVKPGEKKPKTTPEQRFTTLRTVITDGDMTVGERLDQIQKDFESFLEPVRELGLVDLEDLKRDDLMMGRDELQLDHAIQINASTDEEPKLATVADIILAETMKETGRLGGRWSTFPRLVAMKSLLEPWMQSELPPTLQFAAEDTLKSREEAANNVENEYDAYTAGSVLIEPGTVLDESHLELLSLEHEAVSVETPVANRILRGVTAFLMFGVLAAIFASYLVRSEPGLIQDPKQLAVFLALCVGTVWLARIVSIDPWRAEIIPLLAAVMLLAIAYDQVLAVLCAFVLAVVISLSTVATLEHFVVLLVVSVVAVIPLQGVSSRSALIKTGVLVSAVYFIVSWAAGVLGQRDDIHWADWSLVMSSLRGSGWCLMCCYLVSGTLPFIERRFGIVTDISLLELSDISHPLLQELVRRAPGTYNHSIAVATIGEAAAESIGANGLLVRVGAYFHDIGKMLKPEYFIENNTAGEGNRHESLAPAMSTLIIHGHVKDGVELANEHNLPKQIVDFIEQHHGTTLVEYFYHEATRQADPDHKSETNEENFRYPGPKPQTKEAGVMMLTDAVESASRTLSEPTPKRIENLVHEIIMKRLHDGQFDECDLTLREIHTIEESLIKSLIAIHHGRVKYPEQRTA